MIHTMKKLLFSVTLIFSFIMASCQQPSSPGSTGEKIYQTVSVEKFSQLLEQNASAFIIDVRTPQEFNSGHIAGAANVDFYDATFKTVLSKLDKSRKVLVYCKSGGRSSSAMEMMKEMGFSEVYNLDGGMLAWSNANQPIENANTATATTGMSEEQYLQKVAEQPLVLVDFNAVWCGPCKKMMPIIEKIVADQQGKLTLMKVDADENPDLMRAKKIQGIPYFELYKGGKLVWSTMGMTDEATIVEQLK
jgi:thioredoxin